MVAENMLSVVVPIYNTSQYLNRCVSSIANQSYNRLEIILIDDGSTDDSGVICDEWSRKDQRIKVIHKSNGGLVSARIAGLQFATGEYVAFVDSDDWLDLDFYEKLLWQFNDSSIDIAVGGYIKEYDGGISRVLFDYYPGEKLSTDEALWELFREHGFGWSIWDKVYRRRLLTANTWWHFSEAMGEDLEFVWNVFLRADFIAFVPLYGYHYAVRSDSIVNSHFKCKDLVLCDRFDRIICEAGTLHGLDLQREIIKRALLQVVPIWESLVCSNNIDIEAELVHYQMLINKWIDIYGDSDNKLSYYQMRFCNKSLAEIKDMLINQYTDMLSEVISFKKNMHKVYIYGTGEIGRQVARKFELSGIDFDGFVITGQVECTKKDNKDVFSVQRILQSGSGNDGLIIALNSVFEAEVVAMLESFAFTQYICVGKYFMEY